MTDYVWVVLDTLRFDVADRMHREGRTPNLSAWLPNGWERRHTPGNFTFAAHQAFFAGFLPTPISPGPHPRELALRFEGSETITPETLTLEGDNVVQGFQKLGCRTVCIGGVGFFNKRTPLSSVLPGLFQESYWSEELGVTEPDSTRRQVELACSLLEDPQALFLYLNVSALHQPNYFYLEGALEDSVETQAAALQYVDGALGPLIQAFQKRGPAQFWLFSDHGTAYGEDGYRGHRLNHETVGTVPFARFAV